MIVHDLGIQPRALPVLAERVDGDPLHAVVRQRPRSKAHLARVRIAAALGDGVDEPVNLDLRIGMVLVRGIGSDDVRQPHTFARHGFGHDIGGLFLNIDLAAIGHGRAVEQVDGVIIGVIQMPQLFFPP